MKIIDNPTAFADKKINISESERPINPLSICYLENLFVFKELYSCRLLKFYKIFNNYLLKISNNLFYDYVQVVFLSYTWKVYYTYVREREYWSHILVNFYTVLAYFYFNDILGFTKKVDLFIQEFIFDYYFKNVYLYIMVFYMIIL